MNSIEQSKMDYLLQRTVEDLHESSRQWMEDIDFWKIELDFFQKLLDDQVAKMHSTEQKQQLDHFQNLIIYYRGELLDQFEQSARRHAKVMGALVASSNGREDGTARNKHVELADKIDSFAHQFRQYKKDLYVFLEGTLYYADRFVKK